MLKSKIEDIHAVVKRKFDEILAKGNIVSLAWLALFSIGCVAVATICVEYLFPLSTGQVVESLENELQEKPWVWVVSRFLDAGNFNNGSNGHEIASLIISLLGVVVFSTLLVGVCVNIFEGVADAVREGKRRYSLKNHILVLGSSKYLKVLQNDLLEKKKAGFKVLIMGPEKQDFMDDFIYYKGRRFVENDLKDACPDRAREIYILGGDNELDHDDKSLRCLKLLKKMCAEANHQIKCTLLLREQTSVEVFQYLKLKGGDSGKGGWTATGKNLLVNVLNEYECYAEMLLVNEEHAFLPIIKENEDARSHVIIMGFGPMAQALAYTVAHVSHYPNFIRTGKKTSISFIGEGARAWMDELLSARPGLFEISRYTYIGADGAQEVHEPEGSYGDFLDVEWMFVDASETSPLARKFISNVAQSEDEKLSVCTCHENSADSLKFALHLPRIVYDRNIKIAVYSNDGVDSVVRLARKSCMYGNLSFFGNSGELVKYSQSSHVARGQRVNYIYSRLYDGAKENDTPEDWWYIKSEADKSSSIYSANFITLRKKNFENVLDKNILYEAEHRRWMMASLLLGFFAAPENRDLPKEERNRQKKDLFRHFDVVPYDALPEGEKDKDKVLVDAEDFILNGGDLILHP
ncbi:MAG: hypothetical protein MJY98_04770 [Fibrobacter sp.]|nr:hypothetical protein [Fibrobacter sp.]